MTPPASPAFRPRAAPGPPTDGSAPCGADPARHGARCQADAWLRGNLTSAAGSRALGDHRMRWEWLRPVEAVLAVLEPLPESLIQLIRVKRYGDAAIDHVLHQAVLTLRVPRVVDDRPINLANVPLAHVLHDLIQRHTLTSAALPAPPWGSRPLFDPSDRPQRRRTLPKRVPGR
jgi:hypothetical protein